MVAAAGQGNVIAHNGAPYGGIVNGGYQMADIRANRIFDNEPFGIDLYAAGSGGVTPNDAGDGDAGPNGCRTFRSSPASLRGPPRRTSRGSSNSTPSTTFDIDLFSNPPCVPRPQGYVQGETYLGSIQVTTDGAGDATFATDVPFVLLAGQNVAATATDPNGNTSEFSQRIVFSISPAAGPPAGGTNLTIGRHALRNRRQRQCRRSGGDHVVVVKPTP